MKKLAKLNMNLGQRIGLGIIIATLGLAFILLLLTAVQDAIGYWCDGHCAIGWLLFATIVHGLTVLAIGTAIFFVSTIVEIIRTRRNSFQNFSDK